MVLPVVKYGAQVLRERARCVVSVTPQLVALAHDMLDTMYKTKGVGLAAQQVGRLESLCVIDVPADCDDDPEIRAFNAAVDMPLIMFNPCILETQGEETAREGCLSFPGVGGEVARATQVTCQYVDVAGRMQIVTAKGFLARAILHETDHLNGVLYIDRMTEQGREGIASKLKKLAGKNGGVA
jgi:peptide deformylase